MPPLPSPPTPYEPVLLFVASKRFFQKWNPLPVPSWEDTPASSKSPGLSAPAAALSEADSAALAQGMLASSSVRCIVYTSYDIYMYCIEIFSNDLFFFFTLVCTSYNIYGQQFLTGRVRIFLFFVSLWLVVFFYRFSAFKCDRGALLRNPHLILVVGQSVTPTGYCPAFA